MASGQIPCTEALLKVKYANVENLVPSAHKQGRCRIEATGGELYDPWFEEAERMIIRDLRKFQRPIILDDFNDLNDLSQLKALKTLELLFRMNFLQGEDKFAMQAEYYENQYRQELESLPVITVEGANFTLGGGLTRVS